MTLDQQRARFAWAEVARLESGAVGDYTNLAKGFPALVMNSGLMQALAFLQAKDKDHHRRLNAHVLAWLGRTLGGTPVAEGKRFPEEPEADFPTVMAALHSSPSSLYLRATDETMALLRWIRQFADAQKAMGKNP